MNTTICDKTLTTHTVPQLNGLVRGDPAGARVATTAAKRRGRPRKSVPIPPDVHVVNSAGGKLHRIPVICAGVCTTSATASASTTATGASGGSCKTDINKKGKACVPPTREQVACIEGDDDEATRCAFTKSRDEVDAGEPAAKCARTD